MRHQTQTFVKNFLETHKGLKSALEVGSLDVNGNIKSLFVDSGMSYKGLDMRSGGNVDIVLNGHDLVKGLKEKFDLIFCADTLEHDEKFWVTVQQMRDSLLPGGYLLIGVPGPRCPLHNHPDDYWRFMPTGVKDFFCDYEDFYIEVEYDKDHPELHDEIYAYGRKP